MGDRKMGFLSIFLSADYLSAGVLLRPRHGFHELARNLLFANAAKLSYKQSKSTLGRRKKDEG